MQRGQWYLLEPVSAGQRTWHPLGSITRVDLERDELYDVYEVDQWKEIKGIVHGIVTRNMLEKVQEVDLLPWRVFSLICHKRSLDFVVLRDADVYHWLIGISYKLNLDWGQQQPQTIHWKHKDVQHKKL